MSPLAQIPLIGVGGELVDFARTIVSHRDAELPPNRVDLAERVLETTLPVRRGAHMFRLDEDLSGFYALVREDELAWCALGAGRMLRAPTVFEDVVKTI
jgi:3-methyladenine DNA glycosylase/8-oxoguanine DNA glycosylase